MAPFRSLLAPFGRILVTFVEGLGDFLEAFPRQMEICTYVLELFICLFHFFLRASRSLAKTGFLGPLLDTLFIANPSLSLKRGFFTYGIYRV